MTRGSAKPPPGRIDARDLRVLLGIVVLGAIVRLAFLLFSGLPPFDPWRHLQLVDNVRAGVGFTLFDGQPYLWYSPVWYVLCAALPPAVGPDWLAGLLSLAGVPLAYRLLRRPGGRLGAAAGALLMSLSGPVVAFTCHYGPEALALGLTLSALLGCTLSPRPLVASLSGLALGVAVVLRTTFAFDLLLFLPALRGRAQVLALSGGAALPLALTWWRNRAIIRGHDFVFTWDGLATRSADFTPLSTLVVQLHPAVQEGLRRLHEQIVPLPEWLGRPDGLLFMLCGVIAVVASRRAELILATLAMLGYFLLLDRSLSANFFRIYLPLFPVFFLALGRCAGRRPRLGLALAGLALLAGAPWLRPPAAVSLEAVTPPAELLQEQAYLVNSGFYHPEGLVRRFPDKRFVGMPLDPEQFEEFRRLHPTYEAILWHLDFSVQDGLARYLRASEHYEVLRSGRNRSGRRYSVLRPKGNPRR